MNEDKAARYRRAQRTTFWIGLALGVAALLVLLPGGGAAALRDWLVQATGLSATSPFAAVLFAVILLAGAEVVALPMTVYRARLDKRIENPDQIRPVTLPDLVKTFAVNSALAALAVFVIYLAMALSPAWWWLIAIGLAAVGGAVFGRRASVYPQSFFQCARLERSALRDRLEALAGRAGVNALDLYEWIPQAGSGQTNARLLGARDSCRILLSRTLLADFSADELEVIVAHELGHHVHGDIPSARRVAVLVTVVMAAAAAAALNVLWRRLGLSAPNDIAGLPILAAAVGLILALTRPVLNGVSRRSEFRADRFAVALTGRPDVFASAMRRIAARNLAEPRPSLSTVWLFHSHPSVEQRIRAARAPQA